MPFQWRTFFGHPYLAPGHNAKHVLHAQCYPRPVMRQDSDIQGDGLSAPSNTFVREGETWKIQFDGETCRIPASLIGLDYISLLLRDAGKPISAQALRAHRAAAVPVDPGELRELQSESDTESDPILQMEWSSQEVLDAKSWPVPN